MQTGIVVKECDWRLLAGDALVLLGVVFVGLRFHEQTSLARLPFTFIPWLLAWLIAGLPLGLFSGMRPGFAVLSGRILWATLLAAPLGVVLRAAWLGTAALPLFALILGGVSALALLAWRVLYLLLSRRNAN